MVPAYPRRETMIAVREAVEKGWRLDQLEARPGWPSRQTIYRWTLEDAEFAQQLKYARDWRHGMKVGATAGPVFDPERAEAFLLAVRRGSRVRDLVRTPGWPNRERLNRWKRERPDFESELKAAVRFSRELRPGKWARYDEAVADEIIRRVAFGETLAQVQSGRRLPGKVDVRRWKRQRPDFAEALRVAKLNGHFHRNARPCPPALFDHILTRMAAGASLLEVSADRGLPHYVTLMAWQRRDPAFAKMLAWAREEGRWARGLEKVERADAMAGVAAGFPDAPPAPGQISPQVAEARAPCLDRHPRPRA